MLDTLSPGDVVQLSPTKCANLAFGASMMVVTEVKPWGAQGYVQVLGTREGGKGGQAYYRAKWDEMEYVGRAVWTVE